ncbi:hypothetical protein [uncultured Tateyamaria sp.]|nr:hypothetical protein [uncultured Tateyamaria sp.]
MTNTEVEDVLASIRRLVSDDNRPEAEDKTAASPDRLVLTPALRVMDEPDLDGSADIVASASEDDAEDVADEAVLGEQQDSVAESAAPSYEEEQCGSVPVDDETEHPMPDESEAERDVGDDTSEFEERPIDLDAVDLDQDTLMSIQDAFADADEAEHIEDTASVNTDANDDATTLSAKIAALETLIAGQTDEFEPDMAGDGENAGTEPPALAWEDADGDVSAAPQPSLDVERDVDDPAQDGAQVFSNDEDVLDEDALRDLVSDIVREELQGALGERITRNVRKLVRREIHRALAAQDLE